MDQETAGAVLKGQRIQLGISLEEVSRQTYIRPYYLDAIERGDYQTVGDPVYVKGFIHNYAAALGLDAEDLLRRYRRESAAGAQGENLQVVSETRREVELAGLKNSARRTGKRPWNVMEWLILAAGAALFAGFWAWLLYL